MNKSVKPYTYKKKEIHNYINNRYIEVGVSPPIFSQFATLSNIVNIKDIKVIFFKLKLRKKWLKEILLEKYIPIYL